MPYTDKKARLAQGLCIACANPRVTGRGGRLLVHCAYHRDYNRGERRNAWLSKPYSPVARLFRLDSFKLLPMEQLAYAAGLIEGEGWVGPSFSGRNSTRHSPGIRVKMTDEEPVRWLCTLFGGGVRIVEEAPPRRKAWIWSVYGRRAGAVAAAIVHFMQAPRKRTACLLVVKVASMCGWWRQKGVDTRGRKALCIIHNTVQHWNAHGYIN